MLLKLLDVFLREGLDQVHLVHRVSEEELCCFHDSLQTKVGADFLSVCSRWAGLIKHVLKVDDVLKIVHEPWIVLVLEGSLNFGVVLAQEHDTLLFTALIIILFHIMELLLHFLFELFQEFVFDLSNSYLSEESESSSFGNEVLVLQLLFVKWSLVGYLLSESLVEHFHGVVEGLHAFVFADVGPGALDAGDRTLVDRLNVTLAKVPEHVTVQHFAIYHLWLDSLEDLATEHVDLLNKLRSQVLHGNVDKILERVFVGEGSDHGDAIPI